MAGIAPRRGLNDHERQPWAHGLQRLQLRHIQRAVAQPEGMQRIEGLAGELALIGRERRDRIGLTGISPDELQLRRFAKIQQAQGRQVA